MTAGCNIFHDKTDMPSSAKDEFDDTTRTRQVTNSPAGAMVAHSTKPEQMNVVNVTRPRRGHDY